LQVTFLVNLFFFIRRRKSGESEKDGVFHEVEALVIGEAVKKPLSSMGSLALQTPVLHQ
jgi:hypothetical protein